VGEQKILEQCWASRLPIPKAIQNAPDLNLGLELAYMAFWELSTSRPVGWAPGPIPWHVIHEYAMSQHLDEEEKADFVYLIRKMDRAFLEWNEVRQKSGKNRDSSSRNKLGSASKSTT
jgi:hypothetical protein